MRYDLNGMLPAPDITNGLKSALRQLIRPVAIVTAEVDGEPHAMAATAFCEVSMDPPSMLVCINRNNSTHSAVQTGCLLGLNLLAEDQHEVSRRCGGGGDRSLKFAAGDWVNHCGSPPLLSHSCTAMVLKTVKIVNHGTHSIVVGEVVTLYSGRDKPLTFYKGDYLSCFNCH